MNAFSLKAALSSQAQVLHQTSRWPFLKRVVDGPNGPAVLYRFPLPGQALRLRDLLEHAERRGAAVQPVLHYEGSWLHALRHGGFWLATGFVEGETWRPSRVTGAQVESLGRVLAHWHAHTSDRPGSALNGRPGTPRHYWQAMDARLRDTLAQHDKAHETASRVIAQWLHDFPLEPLHDSRFELVHGDLYNGNVLALPDCQRVCLIDYEKAAFGLAGLELAATLLRLFHGKAQAHRPTFLSAYLAACPDTAREDWERRGDLFLIHAQLQLAHGRLWRARQLHRRRAHDHAVAAMHTYERHMQAAHALVLRHRAGLKEPLALLRR